MAQDRDELNRRRQKRAALRKKREREQRILRMRLVAAAVILLVCGLAIYALTSGGETPAEGESTPTGIVEVPTEEKATDPPDEPTTTIHIKAAGDLNVTDASVEAGNTSIGYDYTEVFKDVAPVLMDADLTMMNFEGNLVGMPYGSKNASAPQELVEALDAMGVDLLQMANSYSIYNGTIGLAQTLNSIRSAGIEPVGAFATTQEFQQSKGYTICEVQGIKVAVVAFTKGLGGLGLPSGSESLVNKLYVDYDTEYQKVDSDGIKAILKSVAAEKPDVTIALLHWGAEHNDTIFGTQETIAKLMLNNGVDIIIGSHSHRVQEIEYDAAADTLVAYSLGDFYGDAAKSGTNYSIILDIEITKDNESGAVDITGYSYTPIYTLKESEGNGQRRVVRIEEAIAAYEVNFVDKVTDAAYANLQNALERIEARVDPTAWAAKQEAAKAAENNS